jgi:membrane-anchored protein YejM (alkaline phosphatase superfamily)
MPSVLSYLNYDKPYFAYGQDIFTAKASDKFVINYNNGTYQFFQDDYMQQFDDKKTKAIYNYKTDKLLKNKLVGHVAEQNERELLIKSIIQQYIEHMKENRLRISK